MTYRINLLARHHQRLLEIIEAAHPLITTFHHDADTTGLRHLRRELEEALAAYERFIHEEICGRSMWSHSPEAHSDARALLDAAQQLRVDYETFVSKWTASNASENWARYRLSARCMIQQFRDHVLDAALMSKSWVHLGAA